MGFSFCGGIKSGFGIAMNEVQTEFHHKYTHNEWKKRLRGSEKENKNRNEENWHKRKRWMSIQIHYYDAQQN